VVSDDEKAISGFIMSAWWMPGFKDLSCYENIPKRQQQLLEPEQIQVLPSELTLR
jgi:hypothetical protein